MASHISPQSIGQAANPIAAAGIEPITVRICDAVKLTGISRSKLYLLIRSGHVETVKVGRMTLVRYRSLKKLTGD